MATNEQAALTRDQKMQANGSIPFEDVLFECTCNRIYQKKWFCTTVDLGFTVHRYIYSMNLDEFVEGMNFTFTKANKPRSCQVLPCPSIKILRPKQATKSLWMYILLPVCGKFSHLPSCPGSRYLHPRRANDRSWSCSKPGQPEQLTEHKLTAWVKSCHIREGKNKWENIGSELKNQSIHKDT